MLSDEILKALIEGIIYVAPEPVTLDGILKALEGEERTRVQSKLDELVADYEQNAHGIQIRPVANGYKFSTKAEHHEVLRKYVKSLKPLVRLSKPALETLAVIAYRQPVTMPEIEEIRGVDSGGVIHTLLEKKLVVTAGRKSVVGRPILYRTSKDFLVHFGLKDVGELPSLKEFEELAKRALGAEWAAEAAPGEEPAKVAGELPTPASGETDSGVKPEEASASEVEPSEVEAAESDPTASEVPNLTGIEEHLPAESVAPAEPAPVEPKEMGAADAEQPASIEESAQSPAVPVPATVGAEEAPVSSKPDPCESTLIADLDSKNVAGDEEPVGSPPGSELPVSSAEPPGPETHRELGAESDSFVDSAANPEGDAPKT